MRGVLRALSLAALLWPLMAGSVLACACCSNPGQRRVGIETLEPYMLEEIRQVRFAPEATLFTGEADPDSVKGIAAPAGAYTLDVAMEPGAWVFTLRAGGNRVGALTLALPLTVSVFEVDPRPDAKSTGSGPLLYKEWRLTAPLAATGIFAPSAGPGQTLSLILQGSGRTCTLAGDFTHWTLEVAGPQATYHLFGHLK